MKIGIICAADRELEPFLACIRDCVTSEKAMLKVYEGTIEGVQVAALYCGVCKVNAAAATQILIDSYRVDAIINAGTCGGMDEQLDLFDTVVCTEVAHHDVNAEILTEYHPWLQSIYFAADESLLSQARIAAADFPPERKLHFGRMVTGESFIEDNYRAEINAAHSPLSVDMETAAIAHVCYLNKIPFIAVRTITDTATHCGVTHFEENCAKASAISKDFTLLLLKQLRSN